MTREISLSLAWLLVLSVALSCPFETNAAPENRDLRIGQKYEIVGELYVHSVSDDLNSRKVSIISLVPLRLSGPEIISRQLVPTGSVLTVVDKAPKKVFAFLYPDRYVVRVNTIESPVGIPVVIDLSRGIEGKSTALNPLIFKPLF
ncbi:hypothetical protein [Candidatus Nitrotoga arctica]|uniref:Uncharacterized protein n=1 Tax=Candidatus Nitrotoga arctica TaxID=453162 RepID=A0ABN8ALX0_9PROT|nr:hypothetical protein [Candidatus Nitrotoga arctica]CAG9931718.1 conserved exported protein of unknown function [Candidatus Nitrotoga arctica]